MLQNKIKELYLQILILLRNQANKISFPDYTQIILISIFIGAAVGFAAVFFHNSIEFFNQLFFVNTASSLSFLGAAAIILIPAIGMFIQSLMIKFWPEIARQKGVTEVIKASSFKGGHIQFKSTLFHFLAPVICIGSGGTVGPEGPAAQLGGGVASELGRLLKLSDSRKRMFTAIGAGSAIAAIFNTPMGGIFFTIEIILLNEIQTSTFPALILSSVTASTISRIFLGNKPVFHFPKVAFGNYEYFYLFIILGLITGLLSILFIRYSNFSENIIKKYLLKFVPQWVLMIFVGILVGVCGYFYSDIFGIGYRGINHILANNLTWNIVLVLLIMKFLLVSLVLNSGGFGGIFAPSLFIGACVGFIYTFILNNFFGFNFDPTTFILVSMGAMLGGINSIPISAILIIFEMTQDYSYILPLMLSVVLSFILVQSMFKGSIHIRHLEEQGYRIRNRKEISILQSITVEEIMKKDLPVISEDTSIQKIIGFIIESSSNSLEKSNTFYSIDKANHITGIITFAEISALITEYENIKEVLIAKDIARQDFIKVYPKNNLDEIMRLFEKKDVDVLPVCLEENKNEVIGSIWRKDVIAIYNREMLKYNLADGLARELKTIGKNLTSKVAEGYSIIEHKPKSEFIGKTLSELKLRNKYGLEVLMIRKNSSPFADNEEEAELIVPNPNHVITQNDSLILFGTDDKINLTKDWE